MILTGAEMKALEERAFAEGIEAESLMNEAGHKIAEVIKAFYPTSGKCVVHFGKGHNGGDALVAAALLGDAGWEIELRPAFARPDWAPLTLEEDEDRATHATVATPEELRSLLPLRNFDTHKGQCGRVGIVAGSRGFL